MTENLTWDLDAIFPGGSQSPELAAFIAQLETDLQQAEAAPLPPSLDETNQNIWVETFERFFSLQGRQWHVRSFVTCLASQDVKDEKALQLQANLETLQSRLSTLGIRLAALAAEQPDPAWQALLRNDALVAVSFYLNEERERAQQEMPPELEALATALATDGYHGWSRLYTIVSGTKELEFNDNGETRPMSLYQLQNKFSGDPDRTVRRRAFELFEAGWSELGMICAEALNHQAGYRLALYKHRGWDSVLQEPLLNNRLRQETLDAMWDAIDRHSAKLLAYFQAKARLLGIDKLTWFDLEAPLGDQSRTFTFSEAGDFIVDNFTAFDPQIADFCRMALEARWVEAEDRPGKRAGGYCTSLPLVRQSRIFMTFDNSYGAMSTLAHELGHAYHSWVMRDLPIPARYYSMSLAETASTFNQLVVVDATLRETDDAQARLSLLNEKLGEATAFLMNIRARYDFERAFFERRAQHTLNVEDLSELMLNAQKTAYQHGLAEDGYHATFWMSKLHFYLTRSPFYNFPYTFGYLFSNGVYQWAQEAGAAFGKQYVALLRDTGSMQTEALAQTHLGADLTQSEFWDAALKRVLADVDPFIALANQIAG